MEALTLSSPMIIEVVGLPGSGKSFFATQFAQTFGSALVSQDKIRWTLFAHHTYSDSENSIVNQVAEMMIQELLNTKKTFVLDGGYETAAARKAIQQIANKRGFRILTIVVQTDEPTSRKRATKRSTNKPGYIYKQSLTDDQFDEFKQQYEEPSTTQANVVVISGKHTYSTQAKSVLRRMLEIGGEATPQPKINRPIATNRSTLSSHRGRPIIG